MDLRQTTLAGCYEIIPSFFCDERGSFVKTFHFDTFIKHGLNTEWKEEYYSVSKQGVLRGLHFQLPPHDHEKLVYCTAGCVFDVAVDLRVGSPSYGEHFQLELNAEKANMLYIPRGFAHGFCVKSESATMMYKVSSVYAPEHDGGILWSSVGIKWPEDKPVLSLRDSQFQDFSTFKSPFACHRELP